MHPDGLFLPIVLQGSQVYAKHDPSSNITIISGILAQELCIPVVLLQATSREAAGAKGIC